MLIGCAPGAFLIDSPDAIELDIRSTPLAVLAPV
jgi:hypothetical protein